MNYVTSLQTVHSFPRNLLSPACLCFGVVALLSPVAAPAQGTLSPVAAPAQRTTTVRILEFDFSVNPSGQPVVDPAPVAAPAQGTTTVHIFEFDFSVNPSGQPVVDPVINLGDTIHWVWDTGIHSTTSAAGQAESWNSGVVGPGSTFDHTFNNLGTFNYYCIPHGADLGGGMVSGMSGSITVVPEPSTRAIGLTGLALTSAFWLRRRGAKR
jgi:hypothetical protein